MTFAAFLWIVNFTLNLLNFCCPIHSAGAEEPSGQVHVLQKVPDPACGIPESRRILSRFAFRYLHGFFSDQSFSKREFFFFFGCLRIKNLAGLVS